MIEIIPLEKLQPAEDNPRRNVGDVSELAQSITSVGLIESIVVTRSNGVYTIVAGARRFAAAKMAELAELPCIVRDLDPEERIEIMAVENLQREDLTPVEEASAYRLLVDIGYTQQKIAERIGRTQSHISKRLQLLELPQRVQKDIGSGELAIDEALELTKLVGMPKRLENALREGKRWGGMKRAVDLELKDHKKKEQRGALERKAKDEGVKILRQMDHKRHKYLKQPSIGWDAIEITPAKHRKEPCHGGVITDEWDGPKIRYVCTEPSRHSKRGNSQIKLPKPLKSARQTKAQEKERAEKRKKAEATAARTELIGAILKGRNRAGFVLPFLVRQTVRLAQSEVLKKAVSLLGLEAIRSRGYVDAEGTLKHALFEGVRVRGHKNRISSGACRRRAIDNQWLAAGGSLDSLRSSRKPRL